MHVTEKKSSKTILPASNAVKTAIAVREMATRLWKLRITRNLLPETVAKDINIPLRLLEKVESGRYNFTLDILFRLCEYYGVDADEIFVGEKQETPPSMQYA